MKVLRCFKLKYIQEKEGNRLLKSTIKRNGVSMVLVWFWTSYFFYLVLPVFCYSWSLVFLLSCFVNVLLYFEGLFLYMFSSSLTSLGPQLFTFGPPQAFCECLVLSFSFTLSVRLFCLRSGYAVVFSAVLFSIMVAFALVLDYWPSQHFGPQLPMLDNIYFAYH